MGLHVFYLATMFFVGVTMIFLCVRADSQEFSETGRQDFPKFNSPSIDRAERVQAGANTLSKSELKSNNFSRKDRISPRLSSLLSPDISSKPDSFQYLIRKTANLRNREISQLLSELQSCLSKNQLPDSYTPYIRALQSILRVQRRLSATKKLIEHSRTDRNRSTVLVEISLPPALFACGLFSADILYDSDALVRIIDKLIQIPKNDIPNLIALLSDYTKSEYKKIPVKWWAYIDYADELSLVLKTDIFHDLKRDYAEIRRTISTTIRQNSDYIDSSNEPNLPATPKELIH